MHNNAVALEKKNSRSFFKIKTDAYNGYKSKIRIKEFTNNKKV